MTGKKWEPSLEERVARLEDALTHTGGVTLPPFPQEVAEAAKDAADAKAAEAAEKAKEAAAEAKAA